MHARWCIPSTHAQALEKKQDALIAKMRVLNGRQEELTALVKQEIKRVRLQILRMSTCRIPDCWSSLVVVVVVVVVVVMRL